jgi:hypothetical protein
VATTDPVKSALRRQLAVMVDAMHVPVSAVLAQVLTAAQAGAVTGLQTARHGVISAKTVAHVWGMPPSAHSAKPWSAPRCPCASWPRKRMAKP